MGVHVTHSILAAKEGFRIESNGLCAETGAASNWANASVIQGKGNRDLILSDH